MILYSILALLNLFFSVVPMAAGLIGYCKFPRPFKILTIYFIVVVIVESYGTYQFFHSGYLNWVYYFFTPIEYVFILYAFSFWQKKPSIRKLMLLSIPVFLIFCLAYDFLFCSFYVYSDFPDTILITIFVAIAAYTLLNLYKEDRGTLINNPIFWVCISLILFSSSYIIFCVVEFALPETRIIFLWVFHIIINIISNQFFTVGFICQQRQ